jgi:hypothetical protein
METIALVLKIRTTFAARRHGILSSISRAPKSVAVLMMHATQNTVAMLLPGAAISPQIMAIHAKSATLKLCNALSATFQTLTVATSLAQNDH